MSNSRDLTLVLLGESGAGKSASGNTILRKKKKFTSKPSSIPVTTQCESLTKIIRGTKVTVIDTPDLSDDDLQQLDEHVKKCKEMCKGECVYLLVIQIGRFTEGERHVLERLEKKLGTIRDRTIILFTRGDDLDQPIDDYVKNTNTHLQRLIKDCGRRYQVFNNKIRDKQQVIDFRREVAKLLKDHGIKAFPLGHSKHPQCVVA